MRISKEIVVNTVLQKFLDTFRRHRLKKEKKELLGTMRMYLHQEEDILSIQQIEHLNELICAVEKIETNSIKTIQSCSELSSLENDFSVFSGQGTLPERIRIILDVLLVALSVAFGIRALFLQPFQIPTGSMQPTLFGIHYIDRRDSEKYTGTLTKLCLKLFGSDFYSKAPVDFNSYSSGVYRYLDKNPDSFAPGEIVCDGWESTGDHLFVDRLSIHFKPFQRGEIFIFNTEGIKDPSNGKTLSGFFYIKRLVGLPGDTLKIVNNMLFIKPEGKLDFYPATDFSPKFKRLYSGQGGYHGHLPVGCLSSGCEYKVPAGHYFALGDNSRNSLDSRYWGSVPRKNIIGRALNVFWPISRRWGLIDELEPLSIPSGIPNPSRPDSHYPAMRYQ